MILRRMPHATSFILVIVPLLIMENKLVVEGKNAIIVIGIIAAINCHRSPILRTVQEYFWRA